MKSVTQLSFENSRLSVVPAVHFRVPFAEEVNRRCHDRSSIPDAIAVELGPATAAAVREWMIEIGIGRERRRLPFMLALIKQNRHVHPRMRERATELQRTSGLPLDKLPGEVLKETLGYSPLRVLYLSAVDSIVEAIRCSIELNIPLYGVDLEDFAAAQRKDFMLQSTSSAAGRVDEYVRRNMSMADAHRDTVIDSRRETAMAARLKTVLDRHRRVVFTCGLAHWEALQNRLRDTELAPAPVEPNPSSPQADFRRAVVHPTMALYHCDVFPAVVDRYEMHRLAEPTSNTALRENRVNVSKLFLDILQHGYRLNAAKHVNANQLDRLAEDWEARMDFERLTANLSMLSNQQVPDIMTVLSAADGCLSEPFRRTIGEAFMEADWVTREEFPDLDVLLPAERRRGKCVAAQLATRTGERGKKFYIDPLPGGGHGGYTVEVPIPHGWEVRKTKDWIIDYADPPTADTEDDEDEEWPPPPPPPPTLHIRSWPPRDALTTALTLRAASLTQNYANKQLVDRFEGSLLDGVHIKSTLRAYTRGEENVYVRDHRRSKRKDAPKQSDGWPIVWLFRLNAPTDFQWHLWQDRLTDLLPLVLDDGTMRSLISEGHTQLTEAIAFCRESGMKNVGDWRITEYDMAGLLLYLPGHLGASDLRQVAVWAQRTKCQRNPCVPYGPNSSVERVQSVAGVSASADDWAASLIRLAIPYADSSVTVVAPDHYRLPASVQAVARQRGVDVHVVPLSLFPRDAVRTISKYYIVPITRNNDGQLDYPEYLTEVFNEPPTACGHLIPKMWLNYGLKTE